jgi:replicative DNA helicase
MTGVSTGLSRLDTCLDGFQRSDLIILAGRTGFGKTSLALNFARYIAVKQRLPVGIFTLEMSALQLTQRLIGLEGRIDSRRFKSARKTEAEWDRIAQATGVVNEAPIHLEDSGETSLSDLRIKARRLHHQEGLSLLVVDYLQLIREPTQRERLQEVSAISRGLKALAKELNIPILALSQLSRAPEQRVNHEPMLSDLRESGTIEQDADVVLLIYRDVVYNPETEHPHVATLHVAKHRNGPTGRFDLFFEETFMEFTDIEPQL